MLYKLLIDCCTLRISAIEVYLNAQMQTADKEWYFNNNEEGVQEVRGKGEMRLVGSNKSCYQSSPQFGRFAVASFTIFTKVTCKGLFLINKYFGTNYLIS